MKKIIIALVFLSTISLQSKSQVCWLSGANIVGEGTGVHSGEVPVLALQNLMSDTMINAGGSGGGGSIHWKIEDLKFKIPFNKSSVSLFASFKSGFNLNPIFFKFWYQRPDASFGAWMTIELTNVNITSYNILAPECSGTNCNIPLLQVSMSWRKLKVSDDFGNVFVLDKNDIGL